ncbi:hypothetical protein HFO91_30275 [Rhizobium leguminosarum]|uniref:hypothetical protein n=1 Tax=Rhizobium leguminosarum TaxID=384 RepID=UPI001C94F4CB|nr:hypothetical protein [Rhizobium leguminosarum]MBY5453866.1 hypothetical protein [Rhizobium leguminosarum]
MAAKVSSARKAGQGFGRAIGGLVLVAALGYFVAVPVASPFVAHLAKTSYYREYCDVRACVRSGFGYVRADQAELTVREHQRNAAALCPDYLNGSSYQRWVTLRSLAWCEGYPEYARK